MSKLVLLDAGPLGMIAHPRRDPEIVAGFRSLQRGGARFAVPEIADYEVRRELLRANLTASVARLDVVKVDLIYLPITTDIMLRAATLWAQVRRQGAPTATAAEQAESGEEAVIATTNPRHLTRLAPAQLWREIVP